MTAVPADTPYTAPEVEPTVAIDGLPLVQVPPVLVDEKVTGVPIHSEEDPVMVAT